MRRRYLPLIGLALVSLFGSLAHAQGTVPLSMWVPEPQDTFVVDVPNGIGYLVHQNGDTVSFPVATGRKGYVHYIGRSYRAETPIRTWTAEQKQIKGDRRTFGVGGRFIRLYRNGEDSAYGIHSYYKNQDWLEENNHFFSMGCILVTEDILDIIEKTFDLSGENMTVITTNNPSEVFSRLASKVQPNA